MYIFASVYLVEKLIIDVPAACMVLAILLVFHNVSDNYELLYGGAAHRKSSIFFI